MQVTAIALNQVADIIAIATSNGRISFFNSEGEKHETRNDIASKESYYCQLIWEPRGDRQLIGGRADGQLFSWLNDDEEGSQRAYIIHNDNSVHREMIRYLEWSDGMESAAMRRLLSIDHGGTCCIWKTDDNNRLHPIMRVESGVEINSFTFLPSKYHKVSYLHNKITILMAMVRMQRQVTSPNSICRDHPLYRVKIESVLLCLVLKMVLFSILMKMVRKSLCTHKILRIPLITFYMI